MSEEITAYLILRRGDLDPCKAVGRQEPGNPKLLYLEEKDVRQILQSSPEMAATFQALPVRIRLED